MPEENLPVLGYWNIRGNAQPIRLLLAYTKTPYVERAYNFGKGEFEREEWHKEKHTIGLDFPNLPYYTHGELKLTQSLTILHYLARKHGLDGQTEEEQIRIDLVEQQLRDYRNRFIDVSLDPNFEKLRKEFLKELPAMLESLSRFLGNRPYFAGNNISFVDFIAYEFIDQFYYLNHSLIDSLVNLKQFLKRIENLPTIYEYQHAENYRRWPSGLLIKWYESKYSSTFHRTGSDSPLDKLG